MDNQPAVLILDASTLLNIYATRRLREIASAGPNRFAVAEYVLREEALFVWQQKSVDEAPLRHSCGEVVLAGWRRIMKRPLTLDFQQ